MPTTIKQLYQGVESSDGLDRLLPLEAIIDQAQESGGLQSMPESEEAFHLNPDLIRRMKNRLFLLGYLKKKSWSAELNTRDRDAIRSFQNEAGITVDGWVGLESWQVMEDLFSFEADSHMERWTGDSRLQAILRRAVQLRLFSFGLLREAPGKQLLDVLPGLKKFAELAAFMNLRDGPLQPDYSYDTLDLLFDQNRIIEGVYRATSKVDLSKHASLKAFAICTAKIELWLLGYPIFPDGKGSFKKPPRRRRKGKTVVRVNRYQTFHRVLQAFCDDVNPGRSKEQRLLMGKFDQQCSAYFGEFVEAHDTGPPTSQSPDTRILVETIRAHPKEAQEAWQQQQSFAGRLWDGVKRAWGWLKRLIKNSLSVVTSLVRNAVRIIWSLAVNSVGLIKAAIQSFPGAVEYLLRPEIKGSDIEAIVFSHDHDFDWRVYVAPNPSGDSLDAVISSLREQVIRFTFSVRLVGLFLQALFKSVRLLPVGYMVLFLAISRLQSAIDPFLDFYKTNKSTLIG